MKSLSSLLKTLIIIGICHNTVFAAEHKVDIKGMAFSPAALTVAVGDTVTFTNQDLAPHTGTATDKSFDTGILSQGQSGTVEITKAGDIDFFCGVHPSMKGQITVKKAAASDTAPQESGSDNNY